MKKDILNISSTLPSLNKVYTPLDIWENTVGRYFDYKKETAMIEQATVKIKEQTKIILKQIDSELKKELDRNDKQFRKEMFRLQTIAKELSSGATTREQMVNHIAMLTKQLGDENIPLEVKVKIPELIMVTHQQLNNERQSSMEKLSWMQGFDSNQKLIK